MTDEAKDGKVIEEIAQAWAAVSNDTREEVALEVKVIQNTVLRFSGW